MEMHALTAFVLEKLYLPMLVKREIKQYLQAPTPTARLIKQLKFDRDGDYLVVSGNSVRRQCQHNSHLMYHHPELHFLYLSEEGGEPDSIPLERRRRRLWEILTSP